MALVNTGADTWLLEYEACERLSRELIEQINNRDRERPGSAAYDSVSAKIRVRLKQYSSEVAQLDIKLRSPNATSALTFEERERRRREVESLQSRQMQMEGRFNRNPNQKSVAISMGTTGWGNDDDDDAVVSIPPSVPVSDLRAQQTQMLRDQDEGLEALSKVIARQQQIASAIGNEVDDQNEILEDIGDSIDRVDTRMQRGTEMIKTITRKDSTWGYWVIIVLLLVIILAVGFA